MRTTNKKTGFTLIELMVVISIIALLSSIVLAALTAAKGKSRDANRVSDLNQLRNALNLYQNDHNGNFPTVTQNQTFCLGVPNGQQCWTGGNATLPPSGNQTLIDALSPYIKTPLDPSPVRSGGFGNTYLYEDGNQPNGCFGGAQSVPGHYILFEPETYPSSNIANDQAECLNKGFMSCCGGRGELCGGPFYCAFKVDN